MTRSAHLLTTETYYAVTTTGPTGRVDIALFSNPDDARYHLEELVDRDGPMPDQWEHDISDWDFYDPPHPLCLKNPAGRVVYQLSKVEGPIVRKVCDGSGVPYDR